MLFVYMHFPVFLRTSLCCLFSALCLVLSAVPDNERITFWSDYPNEELADAICSRMTDEELFAQILMFGWAGQEP